MLKVSRTILVCLLPALILGARSPGSSAFADDGVQIEQFLKDVQDDRLPVTVIRLNAERPPQVGLPRPQEGILGLPLELSDGCCGDEARTDLREALLGTSPQRPAAFSGPRIQRPDYCVFYRDQKRQNRILWISSSDLRMDYFASSGPHPSDQPQDQARIRATPDEVREKLERLAGVLTVTPINPTYDAVSDVLQKITGSPRIAALPFDVMSIDPSKTATILGQKRWKVLGKLTLSPSAENKSDHIRVRAAIGAALDQAWRDTRAEREAATRTGSDGQSSGYIPQSESHIYTAHAFTPRLAISARVPKTPGPGDEDCMLLMSFECKLLELYVDGHFKGCCAITNFRPQQQGQLPLQLGTDQLINDLLIAAGQPLKPKSTSSSN